MPDLKYLAHRRRMIALDEWGYYLALGLLLTASFYHTICLLPLFIVLVYGGLCIYMSYKAYWKLENAWLQEIEQKN